MNKIIEQALIKELVSLSNNRAKDDYFIYSKNEEDNSIVTSKISTKEAVSKILNSGISISTPLEVKYGHTERIKPIIGIVLENSLDQEIIEMFISKIDANEIKKLTTEELDDVYQAVSEENRPLLLEQLFKNGFDFLQGNFNETDKALDIDFSFFEACLKYKKDFSFSYKYEEELTLDQIIESEKEYFKKKNIAKYSSNKVDGFIEFLKKAKDSQTLKNELTENLNENKPFQKTSFKI